jgi:hypothetical protein
VRKRPRPSPPPRVRAFENGWLDLRSALTGLFRRIRLGRGVLRMRWNGGNVDKLFLRFVHVLLLAPRPVIGVLFGAHRIHSISSRNRSCTLSGCDSGSARQPGFRQGAAANAQVTLQRQQELYKTTTVDLADLQTAEANQLQAQGAVETAEGQLSDAKINPDYCTIESPIDGKTGNYLVDAGNLVTANTTKLINIQMIDPIYVEFTISENDFDKVRQCIGSSLGCSRSSARDSTTSISFGCVTNRAISFR